MHHKETQPQPISNEESHLSEKILLEKELHGLESRMRLLGHRGQNDPNDSRQMEARRQYQEQIVHDIQRCNGIAFQLYAMENNIQTQDYELVSTEDSNTYSPLDLFIDGYALGFNNLVKVPNSQVYRKKGAQAAQKEKIWKENSRWWKLVKSFSARPKDMIDPVAWLLRVQNIQRDLSRDVTEFTLALEEIEAICNGELELLDFSPTNATAETFGKPVEQGGFVAPVFTEGINPKNASKIPEEFADIIALSSSFGRWQKSLEELRTNMQSIMESQISLGRDATVFKEMISRIDAHFTS